MQTAEFGSPERFSWSGTALLKARSAREMMLSDGCIAYAGSQNYFRASLEVGATLAESRKYKRVLSSSGFIAGFLQTQGDPGRCRRVVQSPYLRNVCGFSAQSLASSL
jgi:hypothetical protein